MYESWIVSRLFSSQERFDIGTFKLVWFPSSSIKLE